VIDWLDFQYIQGAAPAINAGGVCTGLNERVTLKNAPSIVPVSTAPSPSATTTATGQGFGLYVNGERYIFQLVKTGTATLPNNVTWTLRTYSGYVRASTNNAGEDPSGYTFTGAKRPPMIPGLTVSFVTEAATQIVAGAVDLTAIHTVPDPYYAVSQFDLGPSTKELQFVNLPPRATIRIYSLAGVLVDIVNHDAPEGGGRATWNLRNRSNQFVGSGVYFYHVTTPEGDEHVGKFTVVNAGFSR
jgi:hypothetical protein